MSPTLRAPFGLALATAVVAFALQCSPSLDERSNLSLSFVDTDDHVATGGSGGIGASTETTFSSRPLLLRVDLLGTAAETVSIQLAGATFAGATPTATTVVAFSETTRTATLLVRPDADACRLLAVGTSASGQRAEAPAARERGTIGNVGLEVSVANGPTRKLTARVTDVTGQPVVRAMVTWMTSKPSEGDRAFLASEETFTDAAGLTENTVTLAPGQSATRVKVVATATSCSPSAGAGGSKDVCVTREGLAKPGGAPGAGGAAGYETAAKGCEGLNIPEPKPATADGGAGGVAGAEAAGAAGTEAGSADVGGSAGGEAGDAGGAAGEAGDAGMGGAGGAEAAAGAGGS